jgi:hypothetical protein
MKHIQLFEEFIFEFNSPFSTDEVEMANKFLAKETGLKIGKNETSRPATWPSLTVGQFRDIDMQLVFTKKVKDRPYDENNIEVAWLDHASALRTLKQFHPTEDKLMKKWARDYGFKISNQDQAEANKPILPKEVKKMVEELLSILTQAYGEDISQ